MLPNFFVAGVQKGATTSLHHYLFNHPQIYLPRQKETKFFADPSRYKKGFDFYESEYFADWKGEKMVGEVDPDYIYFDESIKRIAGHFDVKSLKFIIVFRDPVERAFSHYLMTLRRGLEPLSFEEAIEQEHIRIQKDYLSKMHYSYTDRGFYYRQLLNFLEYVDISQMFFLLTEDLDERLRESLKKCFEFLGVNTDYFPENMEQRYHGAKVPRSRFFLRRIKKEGFEKKLVRLLIPHQGTRLKIREKLWALNETNKCNISLTDETRKKLSDLYREDNKKLSSLIKRDLEHWGSLAQSISA